jgi:glycoside hydrolase family 43
MIFEKNNNPVIEGLYADPDLAFFNGRYYLYPTTDGYKGWSGKQFKVFSSSNLNNFKECGVIIDLSTEQVPWAIDSAWAPAIFSKNGNFYFYFCGKREDGISCIGVGVAKSPEGPFEVNPSPLITPEMVEEQNIGISQVIDPSVFMEDDGEVYLLFGNGTPAIVKLKDNMLEVCQDTMHLIEGLYDFREAVTVFKRDGKYHFTWSCDDTGNENYHVNYGVSDNLSGPVEFKYTILEKNPEKEILGTGHHCIMKLPNKDEWVIGYHRFALPLLDHSEGRGYHREICIDKLEFDGNGLIKKIVTSL